MFPLSVDHYSPSKHSHFCYNYPLVLDKVMASNSQGALVSRFVFANLARSLDNGANMSQPPFITQRMNSEMSPMLQKDDDPRPIVNNITYII